MATTPPAAPATAWIAESLMLAIHSVREGKERLGSGGCTRRKMRRMHSGCNGVCGRGPITCAHKLRQPKDSAVGNAGVAQSGPADERRAAECLPCLVCGHSPSTLLEFATRPANHLPLRIPHRAAISHPRAQHMGDFAQFVAADHGQSRAVSTPIHLHTTTRGQASSPADLSPIQSLTYD